MNPGPDFKQTGTRLHSVIANLWEQILHVVIDLNCLFDDDVNDSDGEEGQGGARVHSFDAVSDRIYEAERAGQLSCLHMVHSKQWSVASIKGGMTFN